MSHVYKIALKNKLHLFLTIIKKKLRVLAVKIRSPLTSTSTFGISMLDMKKNIFSPSPFFSNIKCLCTLISFIKETIILVCWVFFNMVVFI